MRIAASIVLVMVTFAVVTLLSTSHPERLDARASDYLVRNFQDDTAAKNAVAAVLLNYRMYDTIFEALILLTAIIGMTQFLPNTGEEFERERSRPRLAPQSADSLIIRTVVGMLYPFMLLLGFFLILNGHYTPGGGFQGGSVLATVFVARYIVHPHNDLNSEAVHRVQRIFLTLIILAPIILLFSGYVRTAPQWRGTYLTLMDVLIGVQVGCGLGVAVLRFAFFQGVGKTWHL